jgi:hypothetical protein
MHEAGGPEMVLIVLRSLNDSEGARSCGGIAFTLSYIFRGWPKEINMESTSRGCNLKCDVDFINIVFFFLF